MGEVRDIPWGQPLLLGEGLAHLLHLWSIPHDGAPHSGIRPHVALPQHSQLHEEDDLSGCLNGIVELDEVAVVQLVHHIDLQQHHLLQKEPRGGAGCQP